MTTKKTNKKSSEKKNYKEFDLTNWKYTNKKYVGDNYVIKHRTQTDVYKFSMGQAVFHQHPNVWDTWEFKLRTKGVNIAPMYNDVIREINHITTLNFTEWELAGIKKKLPWLSDDYFDHLEDHKLKAKYIHVEQLKDGLSIWAEGPKLNVMWWEIYILQIIQHLYFADEELDFEKAKKNLYECIKKWNEAYRNGVKFTISDFGIRRSIDDDWNEYLVRTMLDLCPAFVGTSNMYLAIKLDCKAIGTFAHELYALYQGLDYIPLEKAQTAVLDDWAKEFRGSLGIALSDNFGFKAFLRDFDPYYAKLFDGCRHDSGDPIKWGEMLIDHYLNKCKIDPKTKVACFSDSLNVDKSIEIAKHFNGRINVSFGIGTFLCATMLGTKKKPLSMVMKVVKVNGKDVVKLSDTEGKGMCHNEDVIEHTKKVFDYQSIDDMDVTVYTPNKVVLPATKQREDN